MSGEQSESLLGSALHAQSPPRHARGASSASSPPPGASPGSASRPRRESDSFYPNKRLDVVEFYSSMDGGAAALDMDDDLDDGGYVDGFAGGGGGGLGAAQQGAPPRARRTALASCMEKVRKFQPSMWVFLAVLGCLSALAGYTVDRVTAHLFALGDEVANTGSPYSDMPVWMLYCCALALASCAVCDVISRAAEGSGIPEMKAFLAGAWLEDFLALRTLLAKLVGLILSLGSGLSIGKEGPFVHMSACVASFMFRWPWFRKLKRNPALRRQMYAASVAAGVAAAFGTPIGGVLFSIEVTATYFLVSNLWKAFFAATWCVFALELFHKVGAVALFEDTQFTRFRFGWEVFAYAILGVLCGTLGALFNYLSWRWMVLRDRPSDRPLPAATEADRSSCSRRLQRASVVVAHHLSRLLKRRYLFVLAVTAVSSALSFTVHMLRNDERTTTNEMFRAAPLDSYNFDHWTHPSVFFNLLVFLLVKAVLTSVSVALPLPSGVLTPVFAMGAVAGRLFGETLATLLPWSITPGTYAIVGAAALSSGVTHTLSIAVMVFELTGQLEHILPVLVAVLIAYSLSNGLCQSFYDMILNVKDLPYLPNMARDVHAKTAGSVMHPRPAFLTRRSTYLDVLHMLEAHPDYSAFPCVQSADDQFVIATVLARRLEQAVAARRAAYVRRLTAEDARELDDQLQLRADLRHAPSSVMRDRAPSRTSILSRGPGETWYSAAWRAVGNLGGGGGGGGGTPGRGRHRRGGAEGSPGSYQPLESLSPAASPGNSPGSQHSDGAGGGDLEAAGGGAAGGDGDGDHDDHDDDHDEERKEAATASPAPPRSRPPRTLVQNFDTFMNVRFDFARLPALSIDDAPLQVSSKTPLGRLHYLFAMLDVEQMLITDEGKLYGVVTKADLFMAKDS